jgi:predicted acetyltransferase
MTDAELPIRVGTPGEFDAVARLLAAAFHDVPDEVMLESERSIFEPDRSLVIRDGEEVVAHAGAFTRALTAPGNVVPTAHVTQVAVAPTHRRRRLLTRLMDTQLRAVRDRGQEPLAALWASEGRIYPRFGYGLAAQRLVLEIDTHEVGPPVSPAGGPLRTGTPAALQAELTRVYEHLCPHRPGWSSRDERWWRHVLVDSPGRREGATERRAVVHEGPDGVDGYALWRTKGGWGQRGPRGEVIIDEMAATDPRAYAELWRFLLSIDLTRTATYQFAAVDEPLQFLVHEPRQLAANLRDALWVRLVDVGAALAARRYAAPIDVTIDVTDHLLPENSGRWQLTGDRDGAQCVRTDVPADLSCDVRDLGAAYLGGASFGALAAAGRVRELRAGAAARAAVAFGWHRAPVSIEVF